jgi:Uncharacterized conserved protein
MQLKAFIKNMAKEKNISAQIVMQNYMLERLLERISLSEYQKHFILKGGFLIAAIVGLDTRATMDLDTTLKGYPLTHEAVRKIFQDICTIPVEDDITFSLVALTDIRESDDYPGLRVSLIAEYAPLKVPLSVDITTGDKITPREIAYSFRLLFEERAISVMAYNLETIFAEKLETILSRSIASTRPRDLYDIYILNALKGAECNPIVLKTALEETANKRGSAKALRSYKETMATILNSIEMKRFWTGYQKEFDYAKDISFDAACSAVNEVLDRCYG